MIKNELYYKIYEEKNLPNGSKDIQVVTTNSIENANIVIDPDGHAINMDILRNLLNEAIDVMSDTFDMGLSDTFNNIRIIYDWEHCKTFQTDGKRIMINPSFMMNVYNSAKDSDDGITRIAYLLLHECLHIMFHDCDDPRAKAIRKKDLFLAKKVNIAMDAIINYIIEKSTYDIKEDVYPFLGITNELGGYIIGSGVIDSEYAGHTWEYIFTNLEDDKIKNTKELIFKYVDPIPYENSELWYKGFREGFLEVTNKLRSMKLIESKIHLYFNSLNEDYYSKPEQIERIFNDNSLTSEEKVNRIYDLLGEDIDGDTEVEQDANIEDNLSNNTNIDKENIQNINSDSSNIDQDNQDDQDSKILGEFDKGKIYGATFALYTYNCDGDIDYVRKMYFPNIALPNNIPPFKKIDKNSYVNIDRWVDLDSLSDDLLRSGTIKY